MRLPGTPDTAEWHAKYAELLALVQSGRKEGPDSTTFAWLIAEYLRSAEFAGLREPTRIDYERTLKLIVDELGDQPFALTTRRMIKAVRDSYSDHPRKADKIRQMTSRLYSWADQAELVPEGFNPVEKLKKLPHRSTPITPWSDEEIELFLAHAPEHVATPVMLELYTGQRRQDVITMTWTQFQGGTIRVRQAKTGAPLDIPCHKRLREYLERLKASDRKGVVIATSIEHRAYTPGSFSAALSSAIARIASMPKRTSHGLRYAAAARMEDAGCGVADISAVLGHSTYKMAMQYIEQRKMARRAIEKLEAKGA